MSPEYEGSDDYDISGFPIVDITWRDRVFLNGRDGLGVKVIDSLMFDLSTSVGYTFGRDEDDSDDLRGLGDVDGGAVVIVKGAFKFKSFSFDTKVTHQVTGEDTGTQVEFGPGYTWRSKDGWFLRPGLSATYASGAYMDQFFGVSAAQSGRSGLAPFDADAGIKSFGPRLVAGYKISEQWGLTGLLSYDRLLDDAADSPITRDKDQFMAGLGLSWRY